MTPEQILDLLPEGERDGLHLLLQADPSIDNALNSLVRMACVLAIATDVEPERFAAGIKETWQQYADHLNACAGQK